MRSIPVLTAIAMAGVAVVGLAACAGPQTSSDSKTIIVGSANFPESEIIANIYAIALEEAGYSVETRMSIGSREAYIPALKDGSIDLIPEYNGNLLGYLEEGTSIKAAEDVNAALPAALKEQGLVMYAPAEAEDKDSVTVTAELAEKWDLVTIADLAEHNDELIMGGNAEFQTGVGLPVLESTYGLAPKEFVVISDGGGPKTVSSLLDGTIHAADIFTTSPVIAEYDLVPLEDPESAFASQNVVPIITAAKSTPAIQAILDAISAELTTDGLLELNIEVSGEKKMAPATAARNWLKDHGLID